MKNFVDFRLSVNTKFTLDYGRNYIIIIVSIFKPLPKFCWRNIYSTHVNIRTLGIYFHQTFAAYINFTLYISYYEYLRVRSASLQYLLVSCNLNV